MHLSIELLFQGHSLKLIAVNGHKNGFEFHEFLFSSLSLLPNQKISVLSLMSREEGLENDTIL